VAQRRQRAAVRLLIEQRRQDEKRLRFADDLQTVLSSGCAEVEVTLDDIMSLEALPAYGSTWPCKLCFWSNFRRPLDRLSRLVFHASGGEPLPEKLPPGAVAETLRAEMMLMRTANGCAVFVALEQSTISAPDLVIANNKFEELRQRYFRKRRVRAASAEANAAGQRCQCGVEHSSLEAWCSHLVKRNPKQQVARVVNAPAACVAIVRLGTLCPCRACEAPGVVCAGCLHPRMLHFNTARGNPRPLDPNQLDNNDMVCTYC